MSARGAAKDVDRASEATDGFQRHLQSGDQLPVRVGQRLESRDADAPHLAVEPFVYRALLAVESVEIVESHGYLGALAFKCEPTEEPGAHGRGDERGKIVASTEAVLRVLSQL